MTANTTLIEKRDELKRRLTEGKYQTLVDVFLARINRVIQKITRQETPLSIWLITVILSLLTSLIFFVAIQVSGDWFILSNAAGSSGLGSIYGLGVLLTTLPITVVIVINQSIHSIITLWRDDLLDATESVTSLRKFEDWLKKCCNLQLHFLVTFLGGLFTSISMLVSVGNLLGEFPGYGYTFGIIIPNIFGAAFFYQFLMVIRMPVLLRRYDLKLFAADPATSELLSRLSGELAFVVYLIAFYSAIITLVVGIYGASQTAGIVFVLFYWLLIIITFTLNQTSLSNLIRRAKWKTLKEIQVRVERLQAAENLEAKETMDAINRLLDYHERVNKTRVSALDFRAYLNFINSLLLPLLAFILGNLDKVLPLFAGKP